jgi:uncharacterized membrane protein
VVASSVDVPDQLTLERGTMTDEQLAELIVARAEQDERQRTRRPLPRWLGPTMRALPKLLALVTVMNGLIGVLAIVSPWLRMAFGEAATQPLYTAYSFICPQRDSHTWFIGDVPMAMEQRMVAMYVAFGAAGAAYLLWERIRKPLPTWAALLAIAPALIDVAISTAEIRPSTEVSRLWTGTLGSLGIVFWAYPRFDAQLHAVRERVALLRRAEASPGND